MEGENSQGNGIEESEKERRSPYLNLRFLCSCGELLSDYFKLPIKRDFDTLDIGGSFMKASEHAGCGRLHSLIRQGLSTKQSQNIVVYLPHYAEQLGNLSRRDRAPSQMPCVGAILLLHCYVRFCSNGRQQRRQ